MANSIPETGPQASCTPWRAWLGDVCVVYGLATGLVGLWGLLNLSAIENSPWQGRMDVFGGVRLPLGGWLATGGVLLGAWLLRHRDRPFRWLLVAGGVLLAAGFTWDAWIEAQVYMIRGAYAPGTIWNRIRTIWDILGVHDTTAGPRLLVVAASWCWQMALPGVMIWQGLTPAKRELPIAKLAAPREKLEYAGGEPHRSAPREIAAQLTLVILGAASVMRSLSLGWETRGAWAYRGGELGFSLGNDAFAWPMLMGVAAIGIAFAIRSQSGRMMSIGSAVVVLATIKALAGGLDGLSIASWDTFRIISLLWQLLPAIAVTMLGLREIKARSDRRVCWTLGWLTLATLPGIWAGIAQLGRAVEAMVEEETWSAIVLAFSTQAWVRALAGIAMFWGGKMLLERQSRGWAPLLLGCIATIGSLTWEIQRTRIAWDNNMGAISGDAIQIVAAIVAIVMIVRPSTKTQDLPAEQERPLESK